MDAGGGSVLWYRRSKPQGKVRRRVQDLRIPSSAHDFVAGRATLLDLSHNESARLAADSLLSRGLEGYHAVLDAEGEVDFLSEPEKIYILDNSRDGTDPAASDDDGDKDLESLSAGSQSATQCPETSTDSDPTVTGLDPSSLKDVKRSDYVLNESNFEVYFQSDSRAAGMKDLVREFIRKATMALAIVMDSFSDVELLCDLLEASRKRNVSIHLLLDHLNMNLFVNMWQELKLDSKNFPKLSVRSVNGQTYCAKTGRKLTGQIAESFIITDWTEALTGSYSFSWLSWQVHRSLAVLVKGSAVTPFLQEFHRLNSGSKPVPDFVTYITVPHTTLHAAQNNNTCVGGSKSSQAKTVSHRPRNEDAQNAHAKAKMWVLSNPQGLEVVRSEGNTQPPHRAGTGIQTHEKPPQPHPKPLVQAGPVQGVSVGKPKHTVGAACTHHGAQTDVELLERSRKPIQSHSNPHSQTHLSSVQSQLASVTVTTTAEQKGRTQESNPLHAVQPALGQHRAVRYQSPLKTYSSLEHYSVGTEGLFSQQENRDRSMKHSGIAADLNAQRRQWYYSLNFKPMVEVLSPSTSQQKQANMGLMFPLAHQRGHTSGLQTKLPSVGTRWQDQPQRHHQALLQSRPTTEAQRQSDSEPFSPGAGPKLHLGPHTSQQLTPLMRMNRMPRSHAARPRPVARHGSSFGVAYGSGQQAGWTPFHSGMNSTPLGRSRSVTERPSAGFRGAS